MPSLPWNKDSNTSSIYGYLDLDWLLWNKLINKMDADALVDPVINPQGTDYVRQVDLLCSFVNFCCDKSFLWIISWHRIDN